LNSCAFLSLPQIVFSITADLDFNFILSRLDVYANARAQHSGKCPAVERPDIIKPSALIWHKLIHLHQLRFYPETRRRNIRTSDRTDRLVAVLR
jgi:hypothetical protein